MQLIAVVAYCLSPINIYFMVMPLLVFSIAYPFTKINRAFVNQGAAFFLLFFIGVMHYVVNNGESEKALVDGLRWLPLLGGALLFRKECSKKILFGFYVFFVLTFLYCIAQQIWPTNIYLEVINSQYLSDHLMDELFTPGYVRSSGFNEGPGHVGIVGFIGMVVSYFLFVNRPGGDLMMALSAFMCLLIIYFASAKGVVASSVIFIVTFILPRFKFAGLVIFVICILLSVIGVNDNVYSERLISMASGNERLEIWSEILTITSSSMGAILVGFGRVDQMAKVTVFDSDLIYIFATSGVLGVASFYFSVIGLIKKINLNTMLRAILFISLFLVGLANPFLSDIKFSIVYFLVFFSIYYENITARD